MTVPWNSQDVSVLFGLVLFLEGVCVCMFEKCIYIYVSANGRPALNLERRLDHDGHPLAITTAVDAVAANGVTPWNWRETPGNGKSSEKAYINLSLKV